MPEFQQDLLNSATRYDVVQLRDLDAMHRLYLLGEDAQSVFINGRDEAVRHRPETFSADLQVP